MLKVVSNFVNAIGALNYKGTWNASTNTPALASGVGTKGDYYVVSVAGSTNLDGITLWGVGDWAVFNGSVWQRVEGGDTGNFTTVTATSTATAASFIPSGSSIPTNGVYLPDVNTVGFSTASAQRVVIDSIGRVGINTTPTSRLHVAGTIQTTVGSSGIQIFGDGGSGYVNSIGSNPLILQTNSGEKAKIPAIGGFVVGTAALATNATNGFLYVPTCAGTPTGTPVTQTGTAPIIVDSTNNKLYFYSGGAWRDAGP